MKNKLLIWIFRIVWHHRLQCLEGYKVLDVTGWNSCVISGKYVRGSIEFCDTFKGILLSEKNNFHLLRLIHNNEVIRPNPALIKYMEIMDKEMKNALKSIEANASKFVQGLTPSNKVVPLYGYCPYCGAPGTSRSRGLNGNDICEQGHTYPSKDSRKPGS